MISIEATHDVVLQIMNRRKIGLLITNTDNTDFAQRWPRDGEKFTTLIKQVRPLWDMRVYDCTTGEFPAQIDDCDGYVIGGSPASVHDKDKWISDLFSVIRDLDQARKPTVGCCFGHQAIAVALGGTVGRNPGGWGFGVSPTAFTSSEPWMSPPAATVQLFAAHREQVLEVPPAARVLGGDAFCPTGSLAIGDHMMTTEFHPEMTKPFFLELCVAFAGYIGDEKAGEAMRQAQDVEAQGPLFAEWMAKFLEMPRPLHG